MSFLTPDNIRWALVAVAVLLLYLVRLGGRRQDVSTYVLWQRAFARRSGWSRRWQRWVSLAVALLFVGLLVLALTRPFWTAAFARARSVVLVIDTSASMNATDVQPSRLTRAKDLARQIVGRMEPYEQAAVVSAGAGVAVACGFTRDPDLIRAAVDTEPASEGPTRMANAVALARRMVAGRPNPQIIVLTDAAFDVADELAAADDLNLVVVAGDPAKADNVGITRLATRPVQVGDSIQREMLVEVSNFGASRVECKLTARQVGENEKVSKEASKFIEFDATLEVRPNDSETCVFALPAALAGLFVANLDRDDPLPADDRAQMLIAPVPQKRVVVVAGADSPVAVALSGLGDAEVQVVDALPDDPDLAATSNEGPDKPLAAAVTVFHGRVPDILPAGPTLVVEPDASCDLWQMGDASGVARQVVGRVSHVQESPLLAGVDLSRVVMEEKVGLEMTGSFEPLVVDESETPLYLLIRRPDGAGPVLVLTPRLAKSKSDLTLRRDLPLLLANAVHWLGVHDRGVYSGMSTADLVQINSSPEARTLVSPDGRLSPLKAGQSLVGPLARGGQWSVTTANPATSGEAADEVGAEARNPESGSSKSGSSESSRADSGSSESKGADSMLRSDAPSPPESVIAVSLLDAAESDIRPRVAPSPELPDTLLAGGPSYPLWMWLVMLAGLICLVEWYLYHRRILV